MVPWREQYVLFRIYLYVVNIFFNVFTFLMTSISMNSRLVLLYSMVNLPLLFILLVRFLKPLSFSNVCDHRVCQLRSISLFPTGYIWKSNSSINVDCSYIWTSSTNAHLVAHVTEVIHNPKRASKTFGKVLVLVPGHSPCKKVTICSSTCVPTAPLMYP